MPIFKKTLAIDFDGVIHDYKNPVQGRRMGAPITGTKETLTRLKANGNKIIIHTVWGDEKGKQTIADFMKYYGLPFDDITNIKPSADFYIDDHGIHFDNWENVLKELK